MFRAGTPQRGTLDRRIAGLAARQAELSAQAIKPAGWTWRATGEKFADWWDGQDIEARNIWLRSMNVRLDFDRDQVRLDLGDLFELTQQMNASGPVAEWQEILTTMRDNGVQGLTTGSDGSVLTSKGTKGARQPWRAAAPR